MFLAHLIFVPVLLLLPGYVDTVGPCILDKIILVYYHIVNANWALLDCGALGWLQLLLRGEDKQDA